MILPAEFRFQFFYIFQSRFYNNMTDNYEIECWKSSKWKYIHPSQANPFTSSIIKTIRNNMEVNFDHPHIVCVPNDVQIPSHQSNDTFPLLHVFLCGTGCFPTITPASRFLTTTVELGNPTIGLCYQWANHTDMEKNSVFQSESNSQECLLYYHHDCVFGGQQTILTNISEDQSIIGRLLDLILYLYKSSEGREKELWASYLSISLTESSLRYNRIIFSGHSQGSGHVAYLAKYRQLAAAILISGPQDYISDDGSWLDGSYETEDIRCFRHEFEEGTAELIHNNWKHISPINHHHLDSHSYHRLLKLDYSEESSRFLLCKELPWSIPSSFSSSSREGKLREFKIDIMNQSTHSSPSFLSSEEFASFKLFITSLPPSQILSIARPNHNSTVLDHITAYCHSNHNKKEIYDEISTFNSKDSPFLPIYGLTIWRWLFMNIHR